MTLPHIAIFVGVSALAYFLGKLDGKNQATENTVANLIANGFLKYREKSNGDYELVPHPDR
jgi:hypothetical protein